MNESVPQKELDRLKLVEEAAYHYLMCNSRDGREEADKFLSRRGWTFASGAWDLSKWNPPRGKGYPNEGKVFVAGAALALELKVALGLVRNEHHARQR